MGQALYRKYRSKKLSEIVGQEHITTTLGHALKTGSLSHAYLFTGPRGVGKTSIARILAHEVNNLPYDEAATHLDIIEIDAASNRRIDEIRELREKVHNAPASAKYKVYIIDEVHMLTKEAFNALLKTLEEPPAHAIFILATTEAHKVPETIVSRTQRFTFRPISPDEAIKRLSQIAKQESIDIDRVALELVVEHSGGSFRDSLSLLDQVRSVPGPVTLEHVQTMLGIAPTQVVMDLLATTNAGQIKPLLEQLSSLEQAGYQAPQLAHQLSEVLRQEFVQHNQADTAETTRLLRGLLDVAAAHNPRALLELILLEAALSHTAPATQQQNEAANIQSNQVKDAGQSAQPHQSKPLNKPRKSPAKSVSSSQATPAVEQLDENAWQHILQAIKNRHNSLYGVARMAVPEFSGDTLTLRFAFPFHQKRFDEDRNRQLVQDVIKQQTGLDITIVCIIDKSLGRQEKSPKPAINAEALDAISNIFGPSEVLES